MIDALHKYSKIKTKAKIKDLKITMVLLKNVQFQSPLIKDA